MFGNRLNIRVVNSFVVSFQANCLELIGDAYFSLMQSPKITIDFDEEQISANIFKYIDEDAKAIGLNINISDECRQYCQDVLDNKKNAKSAKRIDLKLSTNWIEKKERVRFYVEAKNLIENDCQKSGRKSPLNANSCLERYVETGIDNFVNGIYPQPGCLLGYVLEGTPSGIAVKINSFLTTSSRASEVLNPFSCGATSLSDTYESNHPNDMILRHYWLDFTQPVKS